MLRSTEDLDKYAISATDGEIGNVKDLYFDDDASVVRDFVVDTGHWWSGHKVLVAPQWVTGVHWSEQTVSVAMSRDAVKNAPTYDAAKPWSYEQDQGLYRHHGRSSYWSGGAVIESKV